jgi:hypothetical protein
MITAFELIDHGTWLNDHGTWLMGHVTFPAKAAWKPLLLLAHLAAAHFRYRAADQCL